jgi:putative Holliday junction resolvase
VGRRRIGLAGCDPLGLTVTPLPCLQRGPGDADRMRLEPLVRKRRVRVLVVGLPLDDAGRETGQARHCRRYGRRLAAALELPLVWVNEHGTSWAAAEHHGLHGDRSGLLDSAAAALILQQWLREGGGVVPSRDDHSPRRPSRPRSSGAVLHPDGVRSPTTHTPS